MRCDDQDDVKLHFNSMLKMREELAGMGMNLDDSDFCSILATSLPGNYSSVLAGLYSTAQITQTMLSPHDITLAVEDEYSRNQIRSGSSSSAFFLKPSNKPG